MTSTFVAAWAIELRVKRSAASRFMVYLNVESWPDTSWTSIAIYERCRDFTSSIQKMMRKRGEHTSKEAEDGYSQNTDLFFENAGRVEIKYAVLLIQQAR